MAEVIKDEAPQTGSDQMDLRPLIAEARAKGLVLRFIAHDVWRTPDELEAELRCHSAFAQWGPEYWELRDPKERPPVVYRASPSHRIGLPAWFIGAIR